MTRKELIEATKQTAKTLIKNNGYIKGMGTNKYRLMSENHTPLQNLDASVFYQLKANEIIHLDHLVYRPYLNANIELIDYKTPK